MKIQALFSEILRFEFVTLFMKHPAIHSIHSFIHIPSDRIRSDFGRGILGNATPFRCHLLSSASSFPNISIDDTGHFFSLLFPVSCPFWTGRFPWFYRCLPNMTVAEQKSKKCLMVSTSAPHNPQYVFSFTCFRLLFFGSVLLRALNSTVDAGS